jgi:hypothetical protein
LINEDGTASFKSCNYMLVVNDLLAHINRGTIELEGFFNGDNGSVNAGTISAWRS